MAELDALVSPVSGSQGLFVGGERLACIKRQSLSAKYMSNVH